MYDEVDENGVLIQKYGPHIFHTNSKEVFEFIGCFTEYRYFKHEVVGKIDGEIVPIPFNFAGIDTLLTLEAATNIKKLLMGKYEVNQRVSIGELLNSQDGTIRSFGEYVYEKVFVHYTEKQWGRDCKELPAFIIKRRPVRLTYDNNYFNDRFQGIPMGGYTAIVEKMLEGSDILLNTDYYEFRKENPDIAAKIVYTGMLDQYFDYKYGVLEYRSVRFETEKLDMENYQGNAVVNYTCLLYTSPSPRDTR